MPLVLLEGGGAAVSPSSSLCRAALTRVRSRAPPLRARAPSAPQIVMCEIDRRVCDVSKEYFPKSMAVGFSDPRMTLVRRFALAGRCSAPPPPHPAPPLPRSSTWTRRRT